MGASRGLALLYFRVHDPSITGVRQLPLPKWVLIHYRVSKVTGSTLCLNSMYLEAWRTCFLEALFTLNQSPLRAPQEGERSATSTLRGKKQARASWGGLAGLAACLVAILERLAATAGATTLAVAAVMAGSPQVRRVGQQPPFCLPWRPRAAAAPVRGSPPGTPTRAQML